ncbi:cobyric acid synthase [Streptococcus pneumoniae]|nr:cobyric acid synthase [Streptococcus pneumoniae]
MVYTSLSSKDGNYPYQLNIAHLYGNLMNTYGGWFPTIGSILC